MQFIMTGFTQDIGFRVFTFEGIAADRVRTSFAVRADLGLIKRYGIRIQELPLLCRSLLERREENAEPRALTFTEEDMSVLAQDRAAAARHAASQKRTPQRKPAPENTGAAWRGTQQSQ